MGKLFIVFNSGCTLSTQSIVLTPLIKGKSLWIDAGFRDLQFVNACMQFTVAALAISGFGANVGLNLQVGTGSVLSFNEKILMGLLDAFAVDLDQLIEPGIAGGPQS